MYRLIYASHARTSCLEDIPAILEWSHAHNPDLGITGVLCLLDLNYMQYLEGDKACLNSSKAFSKTRGIKVPPSSIKEPSVNVLS